MKTPKMKWLPFLVLGALTLFAVASVLFHHGKEQVSIHDEQAPEITGLIK